MKFQIEKLIIDGKQIDLSRVAKGDGNVFTMLVGKNAVGKTRALSKVVNNYLFSKNSSEVFESYDSERLPSQVIAVSNSKFDRFPDPTLPGRHVTSFGIDYHYLGLGGFRSSPSRILSKGCEAIFDGPDSDPFRRSNLANIFDYVGFLPLFNLEFRKPFSRFNKNENSIDVLYDEYQRAMAFSNHPEDHIRKFQFEQEILPALHYLQSLERNNRGMSFRIDLTQQYLGDHEFRELNRYALPLLKSGMLKVSRLTLFDKKTKDKVPFHQASSGQQCMLLMFLGMAGSMSNNSLICIDEPEISLHPKWQAEFIGIIQNAFSSYTGCHFLIATHSPQIISGLVVENGFVADLESEVLIHSSNYSKKSADFQLTEIFHEPGFKNEYLIRTLLVLLSKLTNDGQLSDGERLKLQHIEDVKHRIEASDPVLHLFNQVRMLAK